MKTLMESVCARLLETFGEPIGDVPSTVGVPDERDLNETRNRVSSKEIEVTWEDLFVNNMEEPTVDELASWLGSTPEAVEAALPKWLIIDDEGYVLDGGMSSRANNNPPEKSGVFRRGDLKMAEGKGMSKKGAKSWIKGTKKFSDKVAKARRAGMKNPEGFAAWAQHKATGKWPREA